MPSYIPLYTNITQDTAGGSTARVFPVAEAAVAVLVTVAVAVRRRVTFQDVGSACSSSRIGEKPSHG